MFIRGWGHVSTKIRIVRYPTLATCLVKELHSIDDDEFSILEALLQRSRNLLVRSQLTQDAGSVLDLFILHISIPRSTTYKLIYIQIPAQQGTYKQ